MARSEQTRQKLTRMKCAFDDKNWGNNVDSISNSQRLFSYRKDQRQVVTKQTEVQTKQIGVPNDFFRTKQRTQLPNINFQNLFNQ